jgi:pimeloyl-ACP methyl ester carboxylesterase
VAPEGRHVTDIILVPGLWLDGSSWDQVVPTLERAGHHAHPLTLPGMESRDADRSRVTLRDHVDAVVEAIDACAADGQVVLVGHSGGCGIAHAAVDARPDRVARVVYVGGFPAGPGDTIADEFPAEDGEVPLPDWSAFEEADLVDLDDQARAAFRDRAIPSPARVVGDPQRLSDERRYDVPVTVIATEFTGDMLRGWIERGLAPVRELARLHEVEYVDLPTGHWPQFTRPEELARAILRAGSPADLDEQGRPEPPLAGDETATLLGFLDYQRATLAWKCSGLDAAGLGATVGASSMTLGGLLKHLAYVEDNWFGRWLLGLDRRGHPRAAPRALAGRRGPLPLPGRPGPGRRRPGRAGPAHLARRSGAQPALDPGPHDRGVRAPQRPCRPASGVGRRACR